MLGQLQMKNPSQFPHFITCMSWVRIYLAEGHVCSKRATGNIFSQREISGVDLFNLTLFCLFWPKAYLCEVVAYVHNMNPINQPYSNSQILRAEQRLGLWLKVGSTSSGWAYRPIILLRRHMYWWEAYPLGVHGEDTDYMIDIDEAKFKLESQNRKWGKVTRQRRCDACRKYEKGEGGISLIMGICGDEADPFEFHQQFARGGTGLWQFYCYMHDFIEFLDVNGPGNSYCFTMDNLNIHKNPIIVDLIKDAGHRVVYCAPYWSCDGAIKYVFNTIHSKVADVEQGWSKQS
jgi:hypothetical protein